MKRSELDESVKRLNKRLCRPETASTIENEKYKKNQGHLFLDHNGYYGGYRLEEIQGQGVGGFANNSGCEARMSNPEITAYLRGIHDALDAISGKWMLLHDALDALPDGHRLRQTVADYRVKSPGTLCRCMLTKIGRA